MKYIAKITIKKPLAEVMKKLLYKENMQYWMKGFKSYETQKGKAFQKGSVSILILDVGVKQIEMFEKITESNLPFSYKANYDSQGVTNTVKNTFKIIDSETTIWVQESDLKISSFALKPFSKLVFSIFKSVSQSTLESFKIYVEEK